MLSLLLPLININQRNEWIDRVNTLKQEYPLEMKTHTIFLAVTASYLLRQIVLMMKRLLPPM